MITHLFVVFVVAVWLVLVLYCAAHWKRWNNE